MASEDLQRQVEEWLRWDPNEATKARVQELKEAGNWKELASLFQPRIAFGTAGLRSRMAPGYACMNHLVVLQATQGFGKYLIAQLGEGEVQRRGVVLGYDGRHNSKAFAELATAVLISLGIKVHLFNRMVCTPMVPYAVLVLKAAGGIMVTASHNPKDDNGYKVYWENGAQIIPPHDTGIAASILANLQPWQSYTFDGSHALRNDPTDAIIDSYMSEIGKRYSFHKAENATKSPLKVTFTAMHGVGAYFAERAFREFNLPPYIDVKEQNTPDPDFPTVKFPNPEEGKGALALAMQTAEREGSRLILAADPDADRLAVAERDEKTGEWTIFNGNQIALLLADWVWTNWLKQNPTGDKSKCIMVSSSVSSQILGSMAEKEGFQFQSTLTGFKWMGNAAADALKRGLNFLFAFEVEIGFLVGDLSLDKDGVRTAAVFAELANRWALENTTLVQRLDQLYKKYGYYTMNTSYFFCDNPEKIVRVCERLRTLKDGSYPDACGEFKINSTRDVTLGVDTGEVDRVCKLPRTPDAQMLTFRFANGGTATLRNSGTEPKLKYYVECHAGTEAESRQVTDKLTQALIAEFIQPDANGLVAPKRD